MTNPAWWSPIFGGKSSRQSGRAAPFVGYKKMRLSPQIL
jgi:hypothetical protein